MPVMYALPPYRAICADADMRGNEESAMAGVRFGF